MIINKILLLAYKMSFNESLKIPFGTHRM